MELVEQGVMIILFAFSISLMIMYFTTLNKSVSDLASNINEDKNLYQQYDVPIEENNTMSGVEIIGLIRNGSDYTVTVNGNKVTDFGYLADVSFINTNATYRFIYKIGPDGNINELSFSLL